MHLGYVGIRTIQIDSGDILECICNLATSHHRAHWKKMNSKRLGTQAALPPPIKLELRETNLIAGAQQQHDVMCPKFVLDVSEICEPPSNLLKNAFARDSGRVRWSRSPEP